MTRDELLAQKAAIEALLEEQSNVIPFPSVEEPPEFEAEYTEDSAEEVTTDETQIPVVTMIRVAYLSNNKFYLDVQGDKNINFIEGCRRYLDEVMTREWASKFTPTGDESSG